ncbi:MAG: hypothetical protein WAZ40_00150 [Minisyncoccia bacterium]
MKKIVIFLTVLYLVSIFGAWGLFLQNTSTNRGLAHELEIVNRALLAERPTQDALKKKITSAQKNAKFLALALCPTLEATNKDAFCVKNSTEWLSQTILAGTELTDSEAKEKMDELLLALGNKTRPTAKELYDLLRPIEVSALNRLIEDLK